MLQTQALRVGQEKNLILGLTQENSIESSVQDCLPYILIPNGLCKLFLAYCYELKSFELDKSTNSYIRVI